MSNFQKNSKDYGEPDITYQLAGCAGSWAGSWGRFFWSFFKLSEMRMRQVIKHRDIRLLKMIRRTDPVIPTGVKSAQNLGHVYAHRAEICLESGARLCTLGRSLTWISGTFMHTGVKYALNLGHVYAHRAEVCPESGAKNSDLGKICPESGARLCTPGRIMPWIWGTFLPPVHKYELDSGQGFTPWGWLARNLRHNNTSSEWIWFSKIHCSFQLFL